ncbi:MAG: DUF2116 family Zn-ribbon domain-containing protein [Thermoplasmata archaeon]
MDPHKHCGVCGKPVPLEETFCSEKCREEYKEMLSKRRNRMYMIYALLAILLVLMFLRIV